MHIIKGNKLPFLLIKGLFLSDSSLEEKSRKEKLDAGELLEDSLPGDLLSIID